MRVHDLQVWEAFLGVASHGSFSKASKMLAIPVPQISKRVARLEDQLGVRLFQRSTRNVHLTDEGKSLLPRIVTLLEDFRSLENTFDKKAEIEGLVRITSVPYVAHKLLLPKLEEFKKKYPKIVLEINLSKEFHNLIDEGYDMALRIENPKDSDLVYKKLLPNELIFCATTKYLKRNGTPKQREDLKEHQMLVLDIHKNAMFMNDSKKLKDYVKNQKIKSDNANFLRDLCLKNHGILVRARWDVLEEIQKGKLVEVLKHDRLDCFGHIYAVIPGRRYLARRVRVLLDFVEDQFKRI